MTTALHPLMYAILTGAAQAQLATAQAAQEAAPALAAMTDTQLAAEAKRLAGRVSYFNAAEGEWSREAPARGAANADFRACRAEMDLRGLVFINDAGWLL